MKPKEQLIFFAERGIAISYVATRMGVNPTTLTKWLRNDKGITHKNEELLTLTLRNIAEELISATKSEG